MMSIRWTASALRDLLAIRDFIERDKPGAAQQTALSLRKGVERLARSPNSGRAIQTIVGVRAVTIPPHEIYYRVRARSIEILRVYHNRRSHPLLA